MRCFGNSIQPDSTLSFLQLDRTKSSASPVFSSCARQSLEMLKQEHSLQAQSVEATISEEGLQHILIPACELGKEIFNKFRAANPNWRPQSYGHTKGGHGHEKLKNCPCCRECVAPSKPTNSKAHVAMESLGGRPISIALKNVNPKPLPGDSAVSFQVMQNPVMMKTSQHHAVKGMVVEEPGVMKVSVKPIVREVPVNEDSDEPSTRENYRASKIPQHIQVADPARFKVSELGIVPAGTDTISDQATSSEEMSENTMTTSFPDHAMGFSQGDALAQSKASKYVNSSPVAVDEPILVDEQDLFDYVVATRKIPYGNSFSSLDIAMQRKLHTHFKSTCPPCPHCNCNTYVKFRYFNNSGKSNLLQPRYACRNPDTCLTIQEKSGKAGSRDFTFPKPKEVESHKALPAHANANGSQGRAVRQPQIIPRSGTKRSYHDLCDTSEMGERSAKLPNTTLSLQTLNEVGSMIDVTNLPMVETSKARNLQLLKVGDNSNKLQLVKPTEDSNSSSSTRTASDGQTGINVRCRAEASSENGRLIVQPISIQKVASNSSKGETGTMDRTSTKGKIAEFNICMYIDLSATSSS